jgi:hypothetical protein
MKQKQIEIIPIAQKKAARRAIKEEWIEETTRSPDQVVSGYGGRTIAQKKYQINNRDYILRVVYDEYQDSYIVITTYLTSQISRYWKEEEHED